MLWTVTDLLNGTACSTSDYPTDLVQGFSSIQAEGLPARQLRGNMDISVNI